MNYPVGTPKGRLTVLEPSAGVREGPAPRLLLSVFGAFAVVAGAAQETPPATLQEVVVQTKRAELLGFGSTHAKNAVSEDAIVNQRPAADVLNMIDRLPGVIVTQGDAIGGNDWSTRIYVRGMSTATDSSQIGYMVDEFPNGDSVYGDGQKPNRFVDAENVVKVDVGPNGADIGSASNSALGGTVHVHTADPRSAAGVRLALSAGQEALRRGFVRFDSGMLRGNSAAYVSYSETTLNSWPGTGSGDFDRRHVDVVATHQLTENVKVRFKGAWNYRDENDYNSISKAAFHANPNSDGLVDAFDIASVGYWRPSWGGTGWDRAAALRLSGTLGGGFAFTFAPYHHRHKGWGWWAPPFRVAPVDGRIDGPQGPREFYAGTFARDGEGALTPSPGASVAAFDCLAQRYENARVEYALDPAFACADATPIATRRRSGYRQRRTGATWEVRWPLGRHTFTFGGWTERTQQRNDRRWFDLDPAHPGTISPREADLHWLHFDRTFRSETARLYVRNQIKLDRLRLSAGLVWHRARTNYASRLDAVARRQARAKWLPKAGAVYALNDHAELFAAYSRNVQMLSDDLLATGVTDSLKPELSDNLDVGLRWNGTRWGFVAQAFAQRFKNRHGAVNLDAVGGDQFLQDAVALLNIGGVRNRGVELAAVLDWRDAASLYASWSHLDARYADDTPAEGIVAGRVLVNAPRQQWFAEAVWRPRAFGRRWRLAAHVKFVGERFGNVANTETLPAHALLGVDARCDFDEALGGQTLSLRLNATNLTNEDYLAAPDGDQGGAYFIGPPRMVSVTASVRF